MFESVKDLRETLILASGSRERFVPPSLLLRAAPGVLLSAVSWLVPPSLTGRERPDIAVVMATLEGRVRLITPEGTQDLESGTIMLLPAHEPHGYFPLAGDPWRVAWLHLEPTYANALGFPTTAVVRQHPDLAEDLGMLLAVGSRARVWELELGERGDSGEDLPSSLHHVMVTLRALDPLLRTIVGSDGARDLSALEQRLWESLHERWTVEEMARIAGCSASQLHRRCRKSRAGSPMEWLTRLRMQRAYQLLVGRSESVKGVAAKVGYANEFAFSVAFKRHFGRSPSEARAGSSDVRVAPSSPRRPRV